MDPNLTRTINAFWTEQNMYINYKNMTYGRFFSCLFIFYPRYRLPSLYTRIIIIYTRISTAKKLRSIIYTLYISISHFHHKKTANSWQNGYFAMGRTRIIFYCIIYIYCFVHPMKIDIIQTDSKQYSRRDSRVSFHLWNRYNTIVQQDRHL